MTSSNRLFGYISTIYTANAQRPIFRLQRKDHFATVNPLILYLLQIDQLFHHWKSSHYLLTVLTKLYDTFKSHIPKHFDVLYGYCAKANFLGTAQPSFCYCASTNYFSTAIDQLFHQWKSSNYLLTVHRKLYDTFKSHIPKHFDHL